MIRVHRSRVSELKVKGVSVTTETVEYAVREDVPQHRPILGSPWHKARTPKDDRNEQNDRMADWGSDT